jgi:uncharacterized protein involved in exopolysaccharide biosynthesis
MFIGVFVMVFILVVMVTTIVTFILPEAYASTARIRVERDVTEIRDPQPITGAHDPYFIQTEFEVILSEKILNEVIERLNLNHVWAVKFGSSTQLKNRESRALLKRMIELRPLRNTSLINITVYSDDKQEAATIANTVAEVFVNYRQVQRQMVMRHEAEEYKELVDELKKELIAKTEDSKSRDEKISDMIERAAQLCMASHGESMTFSAEIIEHAEPAFRPVRPNKPLNIALGIIIGGFLGLVVASVIVILGIVMRKPAMAEPGQSPPLNG